MPRPRSARPRAFGFLAAGLVAPCALAIACTADAKRSHTTSSTTTIGHAYAYGSGLEMMRTQDDIPHDFSYAVIQAGEHASIALSDADFADELDDLQKEADRAGVGLFWFRIDGKSYRVRDRATVERAQRSVAEMIEIGREQGKYGAIMGRYGARMGEIGALQGRMGALRAQIALHRGGDARSRREIDRLRRELDEIEGELRQYQDEQRTLSRKQGALGKRQGELGRRQGKATKHARRELFDLANEAIANGTAESVR